MKTEKNAILEFIQLGRGNVEEKTELAKAVNLSFAQLKYRVKNFKAGNGFGRKKRNDAGISKKDPMTKTKLSFFAELAMGTSADKAGEMLELSEHLTNRLSKEFHRQDKLAALRNAPQLEDLKEFIKDLFRIDIAMVDAEMNGSFNVEIQRHGVVHDSNFDSNFLKIPVEQIHDLKAILAYCLQKNKMGEIDPLYTKYGKEDLEKVRVFYLLQELLDGKNVKDYAALKRATAQSTPDRLLDLNLMYAVINRFDPGLDEQSKLDIIKDEALKLKYIK